MTKMIKTSVETYPFIELSIACSNVSIMEAFWEKMFGGKTIFRGRIMGKPYSRIIACGITLVFRENPHFKLPPGPGEEYSFNNHIGLRVKDLDSAISELEARGAQFVLTPAKIKEWMDQKQDDGREFMETDFIAPPLSAERIANGEYKIDVAIMVGPDNLWIELNQIQEPKDTGWFPSPW